MKINAISFISGLLFAIGLGISGMTDPAVILAFLDITGAWNPSLLAVMGGAVGVNLILFRLAFGRGKPVFGAEFSLPWQKSIDGRLVGGSVLFGAGWGLVGYCPGPALVALTSGSMAVATFVGAMAVGLLAYDWLDRGAAGKRAETAPKAAPR
jgi:uncharacterized protein